MLHARLVGGLPVECLHQLFQGWVVLRHAVSGQLVAQGLRQRSLSGIGGFFIIDRYSLMGLNISLGFHVDDSTLSIGVLFAPCHGDVRPLQVIQRQRIGGIVPQVCADLV